MRVYCRALISALALWMGLAATVPPALADGDWEITPQGELALERGLKWLERNQGPGGNWDSNDLGLVGMGALAFLADGHTPGRGKYGASVEKALDYILKNAKPSGLLNISNEQRDMYNHGLATFVLGQAHGMTGDARMNQALDKALKLISNTQCDDGGWDYHARPQQRGHDLSLVVMQAKALRSAMDSGLEVSPGVVERAIKSVREHYRSKSGKNALDDPSMKAESGQFTYEGHRGSIAMAAAGVVCLQEFGQYSDWRIQKNMEVIGHAVRELKTGRGSGQVPFDGYTLYYVGQALYQVGGRDWEENYPRLRDALIQNQIKSNDPQMDGCWRSGGHVGGKPGDLYGTAVACFILAMPNRYLPILQEGKIEGIKAAE